MTITSVATGTLWAKPMQASANQNDPRNLRINQIPQGGGPGDYLETTFTAEIAARNGDITDTVLKRDGLTREQLGKLPDTQKIVVNKQIDDEMNLEFDGGYNGVIKGSDGLWHTRGDDGYPIDSQPAASDSDASSVKKKVDAQVNWSQETLMRIMNNGSTSENNSTSFGTA